MSLKTGITKHPEHPTWFLVSENTTYVVGATKDGLMLNLHWGGRLHSVDDIPDVAALAPGRSSQDPSLTDAREELPAFGGLRYGAIGLKAEFTHTKAREINLAWTGSSDQFSDYHLRLDLEDRIYKGFKVELHYEFDPATDVLSRHLRILNGTSHMIHLEQVFSAVWHLPPVHGERTLTTLAGAWAAETQVQTQPLRPGTQLLESKRGIPSAQAYPWLAIQQDDEVYFGTLGWSGSWAIQIRTNIDGQTSIAGGLNTHDFGWNLKPDDSFVTPAFVAGFTRRGLSGARRCLTRHVQMQGQYLTCRVRGKYITHHAWDQQLTHPLRMHDKINPVLYNSWEATGFDVSFESQQKLARLAKLTGAELFVLDDGWFRGRKSDRAGLGDWDADPKKFPHGLKPLADRVHKLGMKFGLWFEPEMVNRDSDLYRAHPDWVYGYKDCPQSEARHQLVLDMTRPDVEEFVFNRISNIIREVGVNYIKWDMNRPISEAGRTNCPSDQDPREIWVRHVEVFYRMLLLLKRAYPNLMIESCSSGGGRADIEAIRYTDQCWTSDNTNPVARLMIQYGASYVLPPRVMACWVTDMPSEDDRIKIPLSFRFHVSFMGSMGLGGDLNKYTTEELDQCRHWVALYKSMRHVLQRGDLDWLIPPTTTGIAATQTTVQDFSEAVVLVFRQHSPFWQPLSPIRLRHLHPYQTYKARIWYHDPKCAEIKVVSGACLMNKGLELSQLTQLSYSSAVIWLAKQ
ncbi:hypothetical protein DFQ28_006562 [Apophysomyces sp. BC1034]|nr:hypothetical protein DFQ30_006595 [Apophysomyces sp. BC1015]KAG0176842.1 hypothetical protein DFQ29_005570 [Apophysomyces sp. BC1021]KAG0187273.1 hypothetical protein DFQ28_006562 [Apophysomyces sp. BC1034]